MPFGDLEDDDQAVEIQAQPSASRAAESISDMTESIRKSAKQTLPASPGNARSAPMIVAQVATEPTGQEYQELCAKMGWILPTSAGEKSVDDPESSAFMMAKTWYPPAKIMDLMTPAYVAYLKRHNKRLPSSVDRNDFSETMHAHITSLGLTPTFPPKKEEKPIDTTFVSLLAKLPPSLSVTKKGFH